MATPKSELLQGTLDLLILKTLTVGPMHGYAIVQRIQQRSNDVLVVEDCLLYTSPSPRDRTRSRMPSSA